MSKSGVYFTTPRGSFSNDLYFSDGTAAGTVQMRDIGFGGTVSRLQSLGNGLLVFQFGNQVRATNGINLSGESTLSDAGSGLEVIRPGVAVFTAQNQLYVTDGRTVTQAPIFRSAPPIGGISTLSIGTEFADQGDGSAVFQVTGQFGFSSSLTTFTYGASTAAFAPAAAPTATQAWFFAPASHTLFTVTAAQFTALPTSQGFAGTLTGTDWRGSVTYQGLVGGWARLDGGRAVVSYDPSSGNDAEPYVVSLSGATLLRDINPFVSSSPSDLASVGQSRVVFTAYTAPTDREPWITDGTSTGTLSLGDLRPGALSSGASGFTALSDGRFIFGADDGMAGRELWVSDGTAGGTRLLLDLLPGAAGSNPQDFTSLADGRVAFTATTAAGRQLGFTDGTVAGTVLIAAPGAANLAAGDKADNAFGPVYFGAQVPSSSLNDSQLGYTFTDIVPWSAGDDTLDGGLGRDVADYGSQVWRGWASSYSAVNGLALSRPGERDTLISIESVQFADGRLIFDMEDAAARVSRLYKAAFDRAPDEMGFNVNIAALNSGSLTILANAFVNSAEFASKHGNPATNQAFLVSLYHTAFSREGSSGEIAQWLNPGFNQGQTRADFLVGFLQSAEMRNNTAARFSTGIWDVDEGATQIERLYLAALDRAPTVQEFLAGKAAGAKALAASLVNSAEFNVVPTPTVTDFITRIYNQSLDRAPEAAGLADWFGRSAAGATRADVLLGISDSAEHQRVSQDFTMPIDAHGIVFT